MRIETHIEEQFGHLFSIKTEAETHIVHLTGNAIQNKSIRVLPLILLQSVIDLLK